MVGVVGVVQCCRCHCHWSIYYVIALPFISRWRSRALCSFLRSSLLFSLIFFCRLFFFRLRESSNEIPRALAFSSVAGFDSCRSPGVMTLLVLMMTMTTTTKNIIIVMTLMTNTCALFLNSPLIIIFIIFRDAIFRRVEKHFPNIIRTWNNLITIT